MHTPQLRTAGVIAQELGVPLDQVLYLIRKLNIQPIGRAGILRLFGVPAVDAIRSSLENRKRQEVANGSR